MSNDQSLSALTRSLIAGVSLGTIALTQVGCAPVETTTTQTQSKSSISVRDETEQKLCQRALRTKAVADANALLTRYPDSRCNAPLLSALPASVLSALSPAAVAGLSQGVLNALPQRVRANLPTGKPVRVVPASQRDKNDRY